MVGRAWRMVAIGSRAAALLPRVPPIADAEAHKEPAMTRNLRTQAASLSLAAVMTLATLMGLNALASQPADAAQMATTTAAQPA
jgi:negative regulator of sigma E activity